jgi:hypothetical protein
MMLCGSSSRTVQVSVWGELDFAGLQQANIT